MLYWKIDMTRSQSLVNNNKGKCEHAVKTQ